VIIFFIPSFKLVLHRTEVRTAVKTKSN